VHLEDLVIYTTTQTHPVGAKAALVLGLTVRALDVTFEDHFSLKGATLQAALEEDVREGRIPFILSKHWLPRRI
jgi:aromatic-L-amino-acid/L-tryptophan decarboxylase